MRMFARRRAAMLCALAGLAVPAGGCITIPAGPSVMVLPGSTHSFEQFQDDDFVCRSWASQQAGVPAQEAAAESAVASAAVGTAVGAAAGAAIGAAAGAPATGAAIGAGSGLLVGSAAGAQRAYGAGYAVQRRYDAAYLQCMYAKGNKIPVARSALSERDALEGSYDDAPPGPYRDLSPPRRYRDLPPPPPGPAPPPPPDAG